jgi:hypothetical protein
MRVFFALYACNKQAIYMRDAYRLLYYISFLFFLSVFYRRYILWCCVFNRCVYVFI